MNYDKVVATFIYGELKEGKVSSFLPELKQKLICKKTKKGSFTSTPFVIGVGKCLGKLTRGDRWKFEKMYAFWKNL